MWIIVTRNPNAEEVARTYLKFDGEVTLGRAPDSTIFLSSQALSRRQGRFEIRNGFPVYFDDESSTGAKVNGDYVRGPTRLDEKSILETGGFRISFERDLDAKVPKSRRPLPAPAPQAAPPDGDWIESAAGGRPEGGMDLERMLAQRITGIRQHRDQTSGEAEARRRELAAEWKQLIVSVRSFQAKLRGDPRVHAFDINREETEVMLKIADRFASRGYTSLILAQHHPDGKYPELEGAWLLELGQREVHFPHPKAAMEEFVHRLAPKLA